jgi:hypothetical protein
MSIAPRCLLSNCCDAIFRCERTLGYNYCSVGSNKLVKELVAKQCAFTHFLRFLNDKSVVTVKQLMVLFCFCIINFQ